VGHPGPLQHRRRLHRCAPRHPGRRACGGDRRRRRRGRARADVRRAGRGDGPVRRAAPPAGCPPRRPCAHPSAQLPRVCRGLSGCDEACGRSGTDLGVADGGGSSLPGPRLGGDGDGHRPCELGCDAQSAGRGRRPDARAPGREGRGSGYGPPPRRRSRPGARGDRALAGARADPRRGPGVSRLHLGHDRLSQGRASRSSAASRPPPTGSTSAPRATACSTRASSTGPTSSAPA